MQTIRNLGAGRLGALAFVAVGLIGFFIFLMTRIGSPSLSLLYADLDQQDSAAILQYLDRERIPFDVRGNEIYVPQDDVAKARVAMAAQGIPSGGNIGYELFDESEGLGTSNFVQNINRVRALEGELSKTISTIQGVRSARVHLVFPQRELFTRERQKPSASVMLVARGGIEKEEVRAIQYLVAAAVPDLKPSEVAIIDQRGQVLASGEEDDEQQELRTAQEARVAYERRLARSLEQLVGNIVGMGRVRAEVSADLDFNRVTENSEQFDPDGQVVRSTQTIEEASNSTEAARTDDITVQNNLPEGVDGTTGEGAVDQSSTSRTEETTNFEISKVVRTLVKETGAVRRLSVAVLIDGQYVENADGDLEYQPRDEAYREQIATLVRSSIGYDADRGDVVEVINMRFAPVAEIPDTGPATLFGLTKADFMALAEIVVLAVVGLLVLLLVVRPVLARLFESVPTTAEAVLGAGQAALASATQAQLTGPGTDFDVSQIAPPEEEEEDALDQMIDIGRVEGRVRASSLRKIGEIVDKHPEEAVAIIRNWMYQDTAT